ncbi:MAG: aldo-keto reductase family protein [Anaerolineae bacterium]
MPAFPMTEVDGIQVSRVIIGSNQFLGYSHYSQARDRWLREYFTPELMADVMEVYARRGVNAIMAPPRDSIRQAIDITQDRTGQALHYIATPGKEHPQGLEGGIDWCKELGASICMPHVSYTDNNLVVDEGIIRGVEPLLRRIRANGMVPGLSTHRPATIRVADAAGYDVATYIQPINAIGFLCDVETDWVVRVINETEKPVMCIKPFAAGRILPPTALQYVLGSCKPIDMVVLGTMSAYEAEEDLDIAEALMRGEKPAPDLAVTRSKAHLVR